LRFAVIKRFLAMSDDKTANGTNQGEALNHAAANEDETTKLERDIKLGETWLIVINALLLFTNIVIACIYYGQLRQMRIATERTAVVAQAAQDSARIADATLREIQKGGTDTHDLAVAAQF